jgi:hypothetical protein
MKKRKLKEDEDGNKVSSVRGIRASCKIMKKRYAKPFEELEIRIPYTTGMNPYSGLVGMMENKTLLVKDGNSLRYDFTDGTSIKQFRKAWEKNEDGCLDKLMLDYSNRPSSKIVFDATPEEPGFDIDYDTGEIVENIINDSNDNGE